MYRPSTWIRIQLEFGIGAIRSFCGETLPEFDGTDQPLGLQLRVRAQQVLQRYFDGLLRTTINPKRQQYREKFKREKTCLAKAQRRKENKKVLLWCFAP